MNRIDFRLAGVAAIALALAAAAAIAGVELFRYWFPHLAAVSLWDEFSGLPIAAIVTLAVKPALRHRELFHLLLVMDVPDVRVVNVYLQRRREGWRVVFKPEFRREALVGEQDSMVRNIAWWGILGIDTCTLCLQLGDAQAERRYVAIPRKLCRDRDTVRLRLSELQGDAPLVVSPQHVE